MSNAVAKRSPAVEKMQEEARKGKTLMGGTTAMRKAREEYLPKFAAESVENYDARLKASWLFNGYRKTVRDMAGRVFDKSVEIAEGAPTEVETWSENIDMQGRDLSTFANEVFKDGLSGAGVSYIMVEAPTREGETTRAQAQAQNLRPYFVHLTTDDVLGWKAETINNVMTLTQFRVMEVIKETDPEDEFAEISVEQVRVLDLTEGGVTVRLYRREDKNTDKWYLFQEPRQTGMKEIMVGAFYANRTGFYTGEPLLDDLADINVAHWQSQSDQRNILHFVRLPILFAAGYDDESGKKPLVIAANSATTAQDPNAKLEWVEHSGKAVDAGRQDLKDLEFQMEAFGLQLLLARDSAQSATGEALDAAKETSQLSMIADSLKDALEQAYAWALQLGGVSGEVTVTVNKDFGAGMLSVQLYTLLLSAVNTGNLDRRTFLQILKDGKIPDDLDIGAIEDRLGQEGPELGDVDGDQ